MLHVLYFSHVYAVSRNVSSTYPDIYDEWHERQNDSIDKHTKTSYIYGVTYSVLYYSDYSNIYILQINE